MRRGRPAPTARAASMNSRSLMDMTWARTMRQTVNQWVRNRTINTPSSPPVAVLNIAMPATLLSPECESTPRKMDITTIATSRLGNEYSASTTRIYEIVQPAAEEPADQPERDADQDDDDLRTVCDCQRHARAPHEPGHLVASEGIGAEPMRR